MKTFAMPLVGILFVLGCGDSGGENLPTVDCSKVTAPSYVEVKSSAFAKCTTCHATTLGKPRPDNAPSDVNFDTYAEASASAKEAASEVNGGAMPPAGFPKLTEEEKQQLYQWALCGKPQ